MPSEPTPDITQETLALAEWCAENNKDPNVPLIVRQIKSRVVDFRDIQLVQRIGEILRYAGISTEDDPPPDEHIGALWNRLGIALAANGSPVPNLSNAMRCIDGQEIWFDEFHQRIFTTWGGPKRILEKYDFINIAIYIQDKMQIRRMTDELVEKAILSYSRRFTRNEPRDWMETLKWDGQDRIGGFLTAYMGAADNPYIFAVSKNFWIGMAARIYKSGCQLDNMIILEGGQGIYKTSTFRAIGGSWYSEATRNMSNKDFDINNQGRLLIEIAELDSFSKSEVSTIKQKISNPCDRYRGVWDKHGTDHPRTCVFVGTTNEKEYLRDSTGGRRFWPVACGAIKINDVKRDRDQLFAEAVHRFKQGETWWEVPKELAAVEQENRRQHDAWEDEIEKHLAVCGDYTTTIRIAVDILKIDIGRVDVGVQRRIGSILRMKRWISIVDREGSAVLRKWVPIQGEKQNEIQ